MDNSDAAIRESALRRSDPTEIVGWKSMISQETLHDCCGIATLGHPPFEPRQLSTEKPAIRPHSVQTGIADYTEWLNLGHPKSRF
jgi:hypothetical protein